ncbi:MAG: sigma-70 family RNA polymerase sigma factor [Anaerolineales bacterium]|jgi:RNA polymerase sigma-70 factor (ECF subfamily)
MHEQIRIGTAPMILRDSQRSSQIERAKRDPAAFAALYREYAVRVYRYIYARVSNHQDAEDLTSQVFEAVLNGLDRFGGRRNFSAWVFTIARNKVVDSYRKRSLNLLLDDIQNVPEEYSDPLNIILDGEDLSQLADLVNELDAGKQELIHLRFAAELTYAEIGEVVGKSEGAVKMSIHRLLDQLQEKMEQINE